MVFTTDDIIRWYVRTVLEINKWAWLGYQIWVTNYHNNVVCDTCIIRIHPSEKWYAFDFLLEYMLGRISYYLHLWPSLCAMYEVLAYKHYTGKISLETKARFQELQYFICQQLHASKCDKNKYSKFSIIISCLINSETWRFPYTRTQAWQSIHQFSCNVAERQTNKLTDMKT